MALTQPEKLAWRKSTHSSAEGSNCVEVADLPNGGRAVRDSKNPAGPTLRFPGSEWRIFVAEIAGGGIA